MTGGGRGVAASLIGGRGPVEVLPREARGASPHDRRIGERYLLVINIPFTRDGGGIRVEPLWAKDLAEHPSYIDRLVMAAPAREGRGAEDDQVLLGVGGPGELAGVVGLPLPSSSLGGLLTLPRTAAALWRAVGECDIVHCCVAGWPYPLGWLAAAFAVLRRRFLIVMVESAPWRAAPGDRRGPAERARSGVFEAMAGWCMRRADLALVTHRSYAATLAPHRTKPTHVLHASWIDLENVLSDDEAELVWAAKTRDASRPLRVVYAGRLERAKGVEVLLQAAEELRKLSAGIELDIYGAGELLGASRRAERESGGSVRVRGVLPYGESFFRALRTADVVVVPSMSDEQPRIVFDAFSQAVPVVASATAGLRGCVTDGQEGVLVPAGDTGALARSLGVWARDRSGLKRMGMAGLRRAREHTHREMHRRRCGLILEALQGRGGGKAERL